MLRAQGVRWRLNHSRVQPTVSRGSVAWTAGEAISRMNSHGHVGHGGSRLVGVELGGSSINGVDHEVTIENLISRRGAASTLMHYRWHAVRSSVES